jgi:V/A-type H+/Na+-transporting ATPase subunit D
MAKLNIAPTKSNLLSVKDQLATALDGYDLLEQKREILVMELMRMVEKVKLLERDIDKTIDSAYPALRNMLMAVGGDRVERIAHTVKYDFTIDEKPVTLAGMSFESIDVVLPKQELFCSFMGTFADSDKVMVDFFKLLRLLTEMASIRTIVWRLANEVKKTQRRVNALDKMIIPQTRETKVYIESVLEERERENVFVLKSLKNRQENAQSTVSAGRSNSAAKTKEAEK